MWLHELQIFFRLLGLFSSSAGGRSPWPNEQSLAVKADVVSGSLLNSKLIWLVGTPLQVKQLRATFLLWATWTNGSVWLNKVLGSLCFSWSYLFPSAMKEGSIKKRTFVPPKPRWLGRDNHPKSSLKEHSSFKEGLCQKSFCREWEEDHPKTHRKTKKNNMCTQDLLTNRPSMASQQKPF